MKRKGGGAPRWPLVLLVITYLVSPIIATNSGFPTSTPICHGDATASDDCDWPLFESPSAATVSSTASGYYSGLPVIADSSTIPVTAAPTALSATSPTKPYTSSTPSPSSSPSPSAAPSPVIREAVSLPRNDDDQVPKDSDNEHRVGSSKNRTADAPIDTGDNDFSTSSNQDTSNAHFVRTGSNSEPFAEQGFSGHGLRISGDSAYRRSLLASLQVRPVLDVVIGPFYGYALDFGLTEVPVGWTPEEEAGKAEEEGKTATEKQAELSSAIHGRRDVGSMYKAETAKAKAGREADEEKTRRMQQRLIDNDELERKRQMDYAALVEQQKTQHEALMQSLQRDADEHETKRQRDAEEREAKRQREHELAIAEAKKSAARSDRATAAALKTKEHYEHLACSLLVALSLLASYVAIRACLFVGYGLFKWPPDDGPPPSDAPAPPKDDDLPSEDDQTPLDNGPPPPDAPAPPKDDDLSSDDDQTPPENSNQSDESATPSGDETNGLCGDSVVSGNILDVSSGDGVNGSGDVVDGSGDNTDGPGDDSNVSGDDSDGSGDEDADDSDPPSEDDVSGRAPPTAGQSVSSVTSSAPAIEQQASAAGTTPSSASTSSRSNDADSLAAAQAPEIPAAPQQPGRSLDAVIEYIKAEREIVTREVEQKRLAEYTELYPNVFGNGNFVPPLRRKPDPTFGTSVVSGQAPGVTMFRKALTNSHRRLAVLGMGEGTDVAPNWANRSVIIQEMETNAAALSTHSVPATPVSTSASSTRGQLNRSAQPIVRPSVNSVGPQANGPQVKSNKSSQARSGVSYAAAASASLPVSHSNGPVPPSNDPLPPSNGPLPASESPVPPARQNSREVAKPPSEFNDTTLVEIDTDADIAAPTSSSSFKSQRPASSGRALSCERLVQFDQIVNSDAVSESDNGEGVSGRVAPTLKNSVGAIFSSAPAVDQQASAASTTSIDALGSRSNDTEELAAALLSSSTSLANEEVPAAPQRPKRSIDAVLQGLDVGRWLATQIKEQKELTANVPLYVSGTLVPTLHRASSPTSTLRPAVTAAPGKLGDSARYGQSSGVALLERALDNSHRPPEILGMRGVNDVVPTSAHRSMYMQEGRANVPAPVNRAAPATSVRLSANSSAPAHLNRSAPQSVRTSVNSVATGAKPRPVNANRFPQAGSGESSATITSRSLPETHNRGPVPPTRQNGQQAARLPGKTGDAKVPKVAADAPPRVHNPKYYFEDGGKKPHRSKRGSGINKKASKAEQARLRLEAQQAGNSQVASRGAGGGDVGLESDESSEDET